jgi:hypothetical protein
MARRLSPTHKDYLNGGSMVEMRTWGGKAIFHYNGSVQEGTEISYGRHYRITITKDNYRAILERFDGKRVPAGTSHDNPPVNSAGRWLIDNVKKTSTASYVLPILVAEGYAKKHGHDIEFIKNMN